MVYFDNVDPAPVIPLCNNNLIPALLWIQGFRKRRSRRRRGIIRGMYNHTKSQRFLLVLCSCLGLTWEFLKNQLAAYNLDRRISVRNVHLITNRTTNYHSLHLIPHPLKLHQLHGLTWSIRARHACLHLLELLRARDAMLRLIITQRAVAV